MNAEREVVDMKVIKNLISKYALMLAVPILLFVVLSIIFHGVIGTNNIPSLMQQAVAPAILGWGVLFNIKVGNWDFSVGSVVLLSAIIGGNIAVRLNWGFAGLLIFCLLVAVLAGVVVGLVYYFLKIPTIITSIGMLLIYESISSYAFEASGNLPYGMESSGKHRDRNHCNSSGSYGVFDLLQIFYWLQCTCRWQQHEHSCTERIKCISC